ncbi:MAG: DUF58 domain-containing protein [Roseovarius sp.]|uniref:DUF58 domain-containing protein n=1 Tax=Roseovarius sp. TaxID=1486281 RepID=UPI0032EEEF8D
MTRALQGEGVGLRAEALIALRHVALAARGAPALAQLPGGHPTRRKGAGLEPADTRDYVPGDDLRRLDRGTTARTGRLHLREYREERDRVTLLVADFRPVMHWGVGRRFLSVAAAEALCMIGWRLAEEGGRVGLMALTAADAIIVPARARARGMLDVIGGMARAHDMGLALAMEGQGDPPLDRLLPRAARLVPPGAEVVLASGFDVPGAELPDRLDALARRRALRLLLVTEQLERHLPAGRYPIRQRDGRRATVRLSAARPEIIEDKAARVAGRTALVIDAGRDTAHIARRIAAEGLRDVG